MQRSDARKRQEADVRKLEITELEIRDQGGFRIVPEAHYIAVLARCAIRGCDSSAVAVWMGFSVCDAHLERAHGLRWTGVKDPTTIHARIFHNE